MLILFILNVCLSLCLNSQNNTKIVFCETLLALILILYHIIMDKRTRCDTKDRANSKRSRIFVLKIEERGMVMNLIEKQIDSKVVFAGNVIKVRLDTITLPDHTIATREVFEHPGGAVILAVDCDGLIFFVKQYRYPIEQVIIELPAGKIDEKEHPLQTAKRELEEEIGYQAKTFQSLGIAYPSPGYLQETLHLFLATDLIKTKQNLDEGEFLIVEKYTLEKAVQMIVSGEISDAKTIVALLKYKLNLIGEVL